MHLSQDDHTPRTSVTGITNAFAHYCALVTQSCMKTLSAMAKSWHFLSGINRLVLQAEVLRRIIWIVSPKWQVSCPWRGAHVLVCACVALPLA